MNPLIKSLQLISILLLLLGCGSIKKGGMLPMYVDEYTYSTESRYFKLNKSIKGQIIKHQAAYTCSNDSIINNSTSIIKTEFGDTITVYSPCYSEKLKIGVTVLISPTVDNVEFNRHRREIIKQFPKTSEYHRYWKCISCKYKNTIGKIETL